MPEPTSEIWERGARGFYKKWDFPSCIDSTDGKYGTWKCPCESGSPHFSYLQWFSIVLMILNGPDYKVILVDIVGYGKNSEGGICNQSVMGRMFEVGTLKFQMTSLQNPTCIDW
jgi:hypothetical protein